MSSSKVDRFTSSQDHNKKAGNPTTLGMLISPNLGEEVPYEGGHLWSVSQ